ncbi:MAG TPA: zinc ribbon domain-containing protein [Bryobacteraceae bacterium]|nr:zinc ribbon domain-containing protein [Bryobacteraceae bacterium]
MFTWICPQCGREVPPAYNECPDCAGKQAGQAAPPPPPGQPAPPQWPGATATAAPPAPPQAPPQAYGQPPQGYPPQPYPPQSYPPQGYAPQGYAPQPYPPPARAINLPPWLLSILFAILFLAVGAGAYFGIRHFSQGSNQASANAANPTETPAAAGKTTSPLQKYVEVVGLRLTEDPNKKPQVRFVVVNHSGAEMADLTANVHLWARTAKSDEEPVGDFTFKLPSLGPYDAKDMNAVLNTKLRVYELPDWQNLVAEIQITSPQ